MSGSDDDAEEDAVMRAALRESRAGASRPPCPPSLATCSQHTASFPGDQLTGLTPKKWSLHHCGFPSTRFPIAERLVLWVYFNGMHASLPAGQTLGGRSPAATHAEAARREGPSLERMLVPITLVPDGDAARDASLHDIVARIQSLKLEEWQPFAAEMGRLDSQPPPPAELFARTLHSTAVLQQSLSDLLQVLTLPLPASPPPVPAIPLLKPAPHVPVVRTSRPPTPQRSRSSEFYLSCMDERWLCPAAARASRQSCR